MLRCFLMGKVMDVPYAGEGQKGPWCKVVVCSNDYVGGTANSGYKNAYVDCFAQGPSVEKLKGLEKGDWITVIGYVDLGKPYTKKDGSTGQQLRVNIRDWQKCGDKFSSPNDGEKAAIENDPFS